jgi:hypothetical protein
MAAPRNNIRGLAATAIKMTGMMMRHTPSTEVRPKSIPGGAATATKTIGTMISHTRGMEVRPKNIPGAAAGAINTISIRRKKLEGGQPSPFLYYCFCMRPSPQFSLSHFRVLHIPMSDCMRDINSNSEQTKVACLGAGGPRLCAAQFEADTRKKDGAPEKLPATQSCLQHGESSNQSSVRFRPGCQINSVCLDQLVQYLRKASAGISLLRPPERFCRRPVVPRDC